MSILNFFRPVSPTTPAPTKPATRFPASITDIAIRRAINDCMMSRRMDIVEVEPVHVEFDKLGHRIITDLCTLQHVIDERSPEAALAGQAMDYVATELEEVGMLGKLVSASIRVDCERMGVDLNAANMVLAGSR